MNINGSDLAAQLIESGIGEKISITEQLIQIRRQNQRLHDTNAMVDLAATAPSPIPVFTAMELPVGPFQSHCNFSIIFFSLELLLFETDR